MVVLPPEVIPLQPINPNGGFPPEFGKIDAPAIAGSGTAAASSLPHWRGGLAFPTGVAALAQQETAVFTENPEINLFRLIFLFRRPSNLP